MSSPIHSGVLLRYHYVWTTEWQTFTLAYPVPLSSPWTINSQSIWVPYSFSYLLVATSTASRQLVTVKSHLSTPGLFSTWWLESLTFCNPKCTFFPQPCHSFWSPHSQTSCPVPVSQFLKPDVSGISHIHLTLSSQPQRALSSLSPQCVCIWSLLFTDKTLKLFVLKNKQTNKQTRLNQSKPNHEPCRHTACPCQILVFGTLKKLLLNFWVLVS